MDRFNNLINLILMVCENIIFPSNDFTYFTEFYNTMHKFLYMVDMIYTAEF